jgi:4-hydroxy-tetrahydrodipicolinate synthase
MPILDESAHGVYIISVTPFTDRGDIDLESTDRLVDFYLQAGATGLTLLGIMGEAPKLTASESMTFVRRAVKRTAGAVPVVVGVSSAGFAAMSELAKGAMDAGAAGVMVAPPAHLRTDAQIVDYFQSAAESLGAIPFVLQDFPLGTGVQISPSTLATIFDAVPTCVVLKHEDWPGLEKITALRRAEAKPNRRRLSILVGNGGVFLPEELARGADGAMTGFAYPEMMVEVCRLHKAGQIERAFDVFDAYLPLVRYEQQPGVGLLARKYVLAKRGAIASAALRKPGKGPGPEQIAEIDRLIARQTRRLAELG